MENKTTDNDIIKALECHCDYLLDNCFECPYVDKCSHIENNCVIAMSRDALDLINRQKAEIESLETEIDKLYEQARADILGNMADGGTSCHWCIEQHETKAIKEFAERLKKEIKPIDVSYFIDRLVQEMVGEQK